MEVQLLASVSLPPTMVLMLVEAASSGKPHVAWCDVAKFFAPSHYVQLCIQESAFVRNYPIATFEHNSQP